MAGTREGEDIVCPLMKIKDARNGAGTRLATRRKNMIFNNVEYIETQSKNKDIGKIFGNLKVLGVLKRKEKTNSHTTVFKCQCIKCNDIIAAQSTRVRNSTVYSCSCNQKFNDLKGKQFGDWTVIGEHFRDRDKTYWPCRCSCGTEKAVRADQLTRGMSLSCGCKHTSKAARLIEQILIDNKIKYVKEKCFSDCLGPREAPLRYDFAILNDNNQVIRVIEYDGEFHYQARDDFFGGEKELLYRQECDKIKDNYALSKNIPLVRIPYFKQDEITYSNLFNDYFLSR